MGDNEVQLNKSDEQKVTTATIQPLPTQPTMATMDIENEAAVRLFLSESSGVEVGKAIEVWGRLANLGHADAMAWLAYCYSNGCLLIDKHISKDLYIKSAGLGNNYSLGVRNAKDSKKSLEYFNKCVEESEVRALNSVGDYYSNGVEKNYKLAFDYFKMSADKGNAVAICNLGVCFQKGYGVEKDLNSSFKYYKISADKGNVYALYFLSLCYENGTGVEKDTNLSEKYFEICVCKGFSNEDRNYVKNLLDN